MMNDNGVLCQVSGVVCIVSCYGSLWTMTFISVNRFFFICKHTIYNKIFSFKGTLACIILIWSCTLLLDVPSLAGLGGHKYVGLYLFCSYTQGGERWFNVSFYTILALGVPMVVITFCYIQIYRTASKSAGVLGQLSSRRQKDQKQMLVSLATIYVAFLLTWLPYAFIVLTQGLKLDVYNFMPLELILCFDLWAHFNSAINFFIYGVTHSGFRRAYKQIISKVIPCYNPILRTRSSAHPPVSNNSRHRGEEINGSCNPPNATGNLNNRPAINQSKYAQQH
ncbi:melatonin receptor type 1A-A-like [Symsagittifera roscoffensis]|uniref:melatonin receptor type 1A-A-like n=1 Tax=Symsagittifera roscoffensis TaxID=84072 RepID=UPI00307CA15B